MHRRTVSQVAKIVQVPSPEEEDDKRLLRSRGNLLRDRIRHTNRIRGLLNLQGVRHIDPNKPTWEQWQALGLSRPI
jgi:transposase